MSKKQLIKDNLLMFVGGNIANALNYVLNIVLIRVDTPLYNLYTAYSSLSLILLIPSLVSMRIFTLFGSPILGNLNNAFIRRKNLLLIFASVAAIALIPLNIILTRITENGTVVTSSLLIALAFIGFIANIFRGIRQHDEEYTRAVISINIEAIGRVFFGYLFAVVLHMGISGILLGHIIGLVGSLLLCYDKKHADKGIESDKEVVLKNVFFGTFMMTAGLEFFSNFDIVYSNHILQGQDDPQTEYNTLQFFRKIIFFGIFAVSSMILSMGGKSVHSKRFMFLFTLMTGGIIGIGSGIGFFILKGFLFKIIGQEINLISNQQLAIFIGATTLMSTAYLLSNWLFSLKKSIYTYVPVLASVIQFPLFMIAGTSLEGLLNAFYLASIIFFTLAIVVCLFEIAPNKIEQEALNG